MRGTVQRLLMTPQRYSARQGADRWAAAVVANGGTVSAARYALIATLIEKLMACGHWWATDDMALLAAENEAQALTTLKGLILMTAVAAPTFTTDRDYAFNGTTQYINTNWNPRTHAKSMSGGNLRIGGYERVNLASTGTTIGCTEGGVAGFSNRNRSASTTMVAVMATGAATFTIAADSTGLKVVSRANNSLNVNAWERGVALAPLTPANPVALLPNANVYIGARNNGGTADGFRAASIAWGEWGGPLPGGTETELAAYTAIQAHLTAIGAQV